MKETYTRKEVQEIWAAAQECFPNSYTPILKSLDDYEKSKERQYPEGILAFNSHGHVMCHQDAKTIINQDATDWTIQHCVNYQKWCDSYIEHHIKKYIIWQVENKKGEVLTVGMETNYGKIKRFDLNIDMGFGILVEMDTKFSEPLFTIDSVHPSKLKILTTKDNVVIDELAMIWTIDTRYEKINWEGITNCVAKEIFDAKSPHYNKPIFYYSKNAEKYIDDNKPRFSKKQILDSIFLPFDMTESTPIITIDKNKLGL